MKVYNVVRPREKKDGSTAWDNVGLTLFMNDEGKISIHDARTGNYYQAFVAEKKDKQVTTAKQSPHPDDPDDKIPF